MKPDDERQISSDDDLGAKSSNQDALLYVDVNLSAERMERIVIREGDDIEELAVNFIR